MGHYTLFKAYSTHLEACFSFRGIWGKDTLFKAFSTYLEACFTFERGFGLRHFVQGIFYIFALHEEMTCSIADPQMNNKYMLLKDLMKYKYDKWQYAAILFIQKAKKCATLKEVSRAF